MSDSVAYGRGSNGMSRESRRAKKEETDKAVELWMAEHPDLDRWKKGAALFRDGVDMLREGHDDGAQDLLHRAREVRDGEPPHR
jgi:hypothetical protein